MRGVILAGGTGSRLYPITKAINKQLLPVGRKPLIDHIVEKFTTAGILDIMVITGTEHLPSFVGYLGSGKDHGCNFTFRVQDQAGGIAQALGLARTFCYGSKTCVVLGDNLFQDSLSGYIDEYTRQSRGAMLLLKDVPDANRFGVADIDPETNKLLSIEEKPKEPKSAYAVTGIYFYDQCVFDIIDNLKPSARGELEITDVNNEYIRRGEMTYKILKGFWTDCGTYESLQRANALVAG